MSDPWRRITEALDEIERGPVVEGGWQALEQVSRRAGAMSKIMRHRERREVPCWHRATRMETGGPVCIHCGAVIATTPGQSPSPHATTTGQSLPHLE